MNNHIAHALNIAVNTYMESQWINHGIDIGFYKAREKLLCNATAFFFEPESTTPINTYTTDHKLLAHCNPVISSCVGEFPYIFIDQPFRIQLSTQDGIAILSGDYSND